MIDDTLFFGKDEKFFGINLPFLPEARNGDFIFYTATDSVLPNPFTSVNDFIPANRLQDLIEFACYPSYWSSLHHAAALLDEGIITKAIEEGM